MKARIKLERLALEYVTSRYIESGSQEALNQFEDEFWSHVFECYEQVNEPETIETLWGPVIVGGEGGE